MKSFATTAIANLNRLGKKALRFGRVPVVPWIDVPMCFPYEADGIAVAFIYHHPADYQIVQFPQPETKFHPLINVYEHGNNECTCARTGKSASSDLV